MDIVKLACQRYSLDQIAIAFNGGKESTAILSLVMTHIINDKFPLVFCIKETYPFVGLEEYRNNMSSKFEFDMVYVDNLDQLKSKYPDILAIIMGTRRTDPHGANLKPFQKTDPKWPEYVRINPLLEWSYHDVWTYILDMNMPFCALYTEGYTSIGETNNTVPNPTLCAGEPAWKLKNGKDERLGRS